MYVLSTWYTTETQCCLSSTIRIYRCPTGVAVIVTSPISSSGEVEILILDKKRIYILASVAESVRT